MFKTILTLTITLTTLLSYGQNIGFKISIATGIGYSSWENNWYPEPILVNGKSIDEFNSKGNGLNYLFELNPSLSINDFSVGVVIGKRIFDIGDLHSDYEINDNGSIQFDNQLFYGITGEYRIERKRITFSPTLQIGTFKPNSKDFPDKWAQREFYFLTGLKLSKAVRKLNVYIRPNMNYQTMNYEPNDKTWDNRALSFNVDFGIDFKIK